MKSMTEKPKKNPFGEVGGKMPIKPKGMKVRNQMPAHNKPKKSK